MEAPLLNRTPAPSGASGIVPGPVAGIDLGGTKIRVGIVDGEGRLVQAETRPTEAERGPEDIMRRMAEHVRDLAAGSPLAAVGIGAPGPINARTGVVTVMPNLPGWEDFPIRDRLERALGVSVAVANDASVAALAEHRYGVAKGAKNMVYLSLGTGIGGGIVMGGRLQNGATGGAGELGHMVLDPAGPPCACGRLGCLETFASGGGIERQAVARLAKGERSTLGDLPEVTMHDIDDAARAGDALSKDLIAGAAVYLGWGIANLAHALNPEMFVFGGGLLGVQDLLIDPAIGFAREQMFPQHRRDLRFEMAVLEEDAGALGAAAIAFDLLAKDP